MTMKDRIFILPLLLGSVSASAFDLHVYYDTNGNCDTFCSIKYQGSGCCPDQNVVTAEAIAEKFMDLAAARDEEFSGFKLDDGTEIMDAQGNLKLTGRQINALNLDSSVTLRTTNTCAGTSERNDHNACVNSDYIYVDDNGAVIDPEDVDFEKGGDGCVPIRDFQVRFHPVPTKTSNYCPMAPYGYFDQHWCGLNMPTGSTTLGQFANGTSITYPFDPSVDSSYTGTTAKALVCDTEDGCFTLYHCGDKGKHGNNIGWYDNPNCLGNKITELNDKQLPTIDGYTLRGYYGHTFNYADYQHMNGNMPTLRIIPDLVAEKSTTYGASYAKRLVKPADSFSMSLGTANLHVIKCPVQFQNNQIPQNTLTGVVIDVFGAWARDCEPGEHGTCNLTVYTSQSGAYDAGDVKYESGCKPGYHLAEGSNGTTYNPQCEADTATTISYSYGKYQTTDGTNVISCTSAPDDGICTVGDNLTLADANELQCGGNYKFYKWQTVGQSGGLYDASATISCSYAELGSYTDANITGILCDCSSQTTTNPADRCNSICADYNGGNDGDGDTGDESQEG